MLDCQQHYSPFGQAIFLNNLYAPSNRQANYEGLIREQRQLQRQKQAREEDRRLYEYQRETECNAERERIERLFEAQKQEDLQRRRYKLQKQYEQQRELQEREHQERQQFQRQSQLENQRKLEQQRATQQRAPIVRQVENAQVYQFQIGKDYGNFKSYEIRVVKKSGNVYLKITSEADDFAKLYELNKDVLDVSAIDWKLIKNENILVVSIPKLLSKMSHLKSHKRKQKKQQRKQQTMIDEPSEPSTESSSTESEFEALTTNAPVAEKRRKLSMEEVEDEESILFRQKLSSPPPRYIIE